MVKAGRTASGQARTHEVARKCDELEDQLKEGPCLNAIAEQHTVLVPDISVESRWPGFAAEALPLGVHSMMSFRLYAERGSLGALNLYGSAPYAFAADGQLVGELFATHAAVALAGASETRQLNTALATRDVIGQAKAILMHRTWTQRWRSPCSCARRSRPTSSFSRWRPGWLTSTNSPDGPRDLYR